MWTPNGRSPLSLQLRLSMVVLIAAGLVGGAAVAHRGRTHPIQSRRAADPGESLLQMPRPGRTGPRRRACGFDRRDAALAAADSGATPIVPGKPDDSELVRRICATDADSRCRRRRPTSPSRDGSGKRCRPGSPPARSTNRTGRSTAAAGAAADGAQIPTGRATRSITFVLARLEAAGLDAFARGRQVHACRGGSIST